MIDILPSLYTAVEIVDVRLRDYDHVDGRLGINILETEDGVVLIDDRGGVLLGDQLAEETSHAYNLLSG